MKTRLENKSIGEVIEIEELPEDNIWRYYRIVFSEFDGRKIGYKLWIKKPEEPKFDFKYPNSSYRCINVKALRIKASGKSLYITVNGIVTAGMEIDDFSRIELRKRYGPPLVIVEKVES